MKGENSEINMQSRPAEHETGVWGGVGGWLGHIRLCIRLWTLVLWLLGRTDGPPCEMSQPLTEIVKKLHADEKLECRSSTPGMNGGESPPRCRQ